MIPKLKSAVIQVSVEVNQNRFGRGTDMIGHTRIAIRFLESARNEVVMSLVDPSHHRPMRNESGLFPFAWRTLRRHKFRFLKGLFLFTE
jgi:hypothetical protein